MATLRVSLEDYDIDTRFEDALRSFLEEWGFEFVGAGADMDRGVRDMEFQGSFSCSDSEDG
jgi:hypothetical protein